jgi:S-adenosylmethionine decarboxylase
MQGLHLTADLHHCQCDPAWLTDAARLLAWCLRAVVAAGLQPVNHLAHTFPTTAQGTGGVTATILLTESHVCIHTWPEQRAVTLDVYVCNFGGDHSTKAQCLMAALLSMFVPKNVTRHTLLRGQTAALD